MYASRASSERPPGVAMIVGVTSVQQNRVGITFKRLSSPSCDSPSLAFTPPIEALARAPSVPRERLGLRLPHAFDKLPELTLRSALTVDEVRPPPSWSTSPWCPIATLKGSLSPQRVSRDGLLRLILQVPPRPSGTVSFNTASSLYVKSPGKASFVLSMNIFTRGM